MVTYADLRTVEVATWDAKADAMRRFGSALAAVAESVGELISSLSAGWSGTAAIAALNRMATVRADLLAAFPGIVAIDQTVTEFSVSIAEAQARLAYASEPRPGSIVQVAPDGSVSLVPRWAQPGPDDVEDQRATEAALRDAVGTATDADRRAGAQLAAVRFTMEASQAAPPAPPAGDPAAVAAWWHRLTPDQRRYVIVEQPAMIAGLDGVPADDRDQASRLLLYRQEQILDAQDQALRSGPQTAAKISTLAAVDGNLDGLQTLEARLDRAGPDRAYLLGIDATAGRAIVSVANPDDAANTLTVIPGMRTGLSNIDSALATIDNIEQASTRLPPTAAWIPAEAGGLATIGWVNYDAPATLLAAAAVGPARQAAKPLSTFESGLRTTSTVPGAHESVLGYSYGSTVVGLAARPDRRDVDDVILVASPGTSLGRASDFGLPAGHVWATAATGDIVPRIPSLGAIVGELLGAPPDQSWFGTNPTAQAFGARVFTSDPGSVLHPIRSHEAYFDVGSTSLANIARIAVGDDADVS